MYLLRDDAASVTPHIVQLALACYLSLKVSSFLVSLRL